MSLVLFLFYWVGIPLLLLIPLRILWRYSASPLYKSLIVVVSVVVFMGLLWLAEGEKWLLDRQVRELCAKDGGVKVYEAVKLLPKLIDKYGVIRIPDKQHATRSDAYYFESSLIYFHRGSPEMLRLQFRIYRSVDTKLLGESINYIRRGGDLPGPWHESSFGCPEKADFSDLKKNIFITGLRE